MASRHAPSLAAAPLIRPNFACTSCMLLPCKRARWIPRFNCSFALWRRKPQSDFPFPKKMSRVSRVLLHEMAPSQHGLQAHGQE